MSNCHPQPLKRCHPFVMMYDLTFNHAIKLTGKTKRTLQRYLSSGKLTYIDSPDGSKLFNKNELLKAVGVTPVTHDMSHLNVTPVDNSELIALAKEQLAATKLNNELLSDLLRTLKNEHQQQLEAPDPIPEKPVKDSAIKSGIVKNDYLYGMTFATKKY